MSPNDLNDTFDWFYLLATYDIISIASHVWHLFHHDLRYIAFDVDKQNSAAFFYKGPGAVFQQYVI